ncbi:MAG: hypothetical protein Q9191_008385 [Dirinaria sp. TL-2023a]
MLYGRMLAYSDDYLMWDLKDKVNLQLKKVLANYCEPDFKSLHELKTYLQQVDTGRRILKQKQMQEKPQKPTNIAPKAEPPLCLPNTTVAATATATVMTSTIAPTSQAQSWAAVAARNLPSTPSQTPSPQAPSQAISQALWKPWNPKFCLTMQDLCAKFQSPQKSYLLPDPPVFTGGNNDEYEYEDWALRIRDKLNGNADRFTAQTATAYVISRIGGEASKHILFYRLRDCDYFKVLSMIFDALHDIYENFERQKITRLAYKLLKQKKEQSFNNFYTKFMLYGRMLAYSNDYLM